MSSKRIIWESQHLEIDTKYNSMKYAGADKDEWHEDSIEEYSDEMMMPSNMFPGGQQATDLSMTPFGVFRMDDDMHPFKQFKLWMGHTNFNLSKSVVAMIQRVDGVELLRIISRYRFIIGIGRAFDTLEVKRNIEYSICDITQDDTVLDNIKDIDILTKINHMVNFLNKYKKWSMLIFPNGNLEFTTDLDPKFDKTYKIYDQIKTLTNSIVVKHGI